MTTIRGIKKEKGMGEDIQELRAERKRKEWVRQDQRGKQERKGSKLNGEKGSTGRTRPTDRRMRRQKRAGNGEARAELREGRKVKSINRNQEKFK